MIRAKFGDTIILGIDAENVRRMKDKKPILVDIAAMGGGTQVMIMYGDTLADIVQEFKDAGIEVPPAMPHVVPDKTKPN